MPNNWDTGFGSAKQSAGHCRRCGRETAYGLPMCWECVQATEPQYSETVDHNPPEDSREYFDLHIAGDR